MSTPDERSKGLLSGDSSDTYAAMGNGGGGDSSDSGWFAKLRYHSPHLVLPLLAALLVALVLLIALIAIDAMKPSTDNTPAASSPFALHSLIHFEDANTHLNGLQQAADKGHGSRRTNSVGYNASLHYMVSVLERLPALRWRRQHWTEGGRSGINLIADTVTGDAGNVVVMGGHLDSASNPGLNDDGSGSVGVLLLAVAVNQAIVNGSLNLVNRIRFHWSAIIVATSPRLT